MNRTDILHTAQQYITKDRAGVHGEARDNFKRIAGLWSEYLESDISEADVAVLMTLLKVARIKSNAANGDNWIDACGYMALGGELSDGY